MESGQVFAHPARVIYQQNAGDTERWLEIVRASRAADAAVFDERPPFFWPAEMSSQRLDAYFTRMDAATTLRNFAADATAGVAFQNSHRWYELPLGQSVEAKLEGEGDDRRAVAVFYTVPDLRLNEVNTSDFIAGVRAGIVRDVSVGFHGGKFVCDICGRDMLTDWKCEHIPGFTYQVGEGDAAKVATLATATIVDAHLSEVSAVYDGATPGAAILKAQREMDAGRLDARQAGLLEQRYRVRLVQPARAYGGATLEERQTDVAPPSSGETPPAADPVVADVVDLAHAAGGVDVRVVELEAARAILQRMGAVGDNLEAQARWAEARFNELRPLAEDGRAYRQSLVDEALAEGTRALGAGFDTDLYRGVLATATIPQLKRMRDDWRTMGDNQFAGGPVVRSSNEPPPAPKETPAKSALENQAYK